MIAERLRIFVSSRMQELAAERRAVKAALDELEVDAWVFEEDAGARSATIQQTYRDQLTASDLYVGIFWRGIGTYTIDEYELAETLGKDRLIYQKGGGDESGRAPELQSFLDRVGKVETGVTIRWFSGADELREFIKEDVARWQTDLIRQRLAKASDFQQQAPTLSDQYIERPVIKAQLAALLSDPTKEGVTRVVLHGTGGAGKTVVAAAFARDAALPQRFPDGVLWATLGPDGSALECLSSWGRSLRDPVTSDLGYPSLDAAVRQLRSLLERRACLLVVDDAWSGQLVRDAFLIGGSRCALLITTRHAEVAYEIGAQIVDTPPMERGEALSLLQAWAGAMQPGDEKIAERLADGVGFLPLALELLGAQARKRSNWAEVEQSFERQQLRALRRSRSASGKDNNLEHSFELSVSSLGAADRDLYLRLAVFERNVRFPVSAAAAVWQLEIIDAEELLLDLAGQALLNRENRDGGFVYSLQGLLHDFVADRLGPDGLATAHRALVAAYRRRCSDGWPSGPHDGYFFEHLAYHLARAGQRDELFGLIDRPWMEESLRRTGTLRTFMGDLAMLLEAAAGEPVDMGQMLRACLLRATVRAVAENVPVSAIVVLARLGAVERALGFAALTRLEQRVDALSEIAQLLAQSGRGGQRRELLSHAWELVASARQTTRGDVAFDNAAIALLGASWDSGNEAGLREVLAVAQPAGDAPEKVYWLAAATAYLVERGAAAAARVVAEEALRIADSAPSDSRLRGSALLSLSRARAAAGDHTGARAAAQEARTVAEATPSGVQGANDLAGVADVLADIGEGVDAAAVAEDVLATCETVGTAWLDGDPSARVRRDFDLVQGNPVLFDPLLGALRALIDSADSAETATAHAVAVLRAELRVKRSWELQILASTMSTLAKGGSVQRAVEVGLHAVSLLEQAGDDEERMWLIADLATYLAPPLGEAIGRPIAGRILPLVLAIEDAGSKVRALTFLGAWLGQVAGADTVDSLIANVRARGAEMAENVAYVLLNLGRLDEAAALAGPLEGEPRERVLAVVTDAMIDAGRIDAAAAAATSIEDPANRAAAIARVACARMSRNDLSGAEADVAEVLRSSLAVRAWDWTQSEGMVHRQAVGEERAKGTGLAALALALAEVGEYADAEQVAGLIDEQALRGQRIAALATIATTIAKAGNRQGALRLVQSARALERGDDAGTDDDLQGRRDETKAPTEGYDVADIAAAAQSLIDDVHSRETRASLLAEIAGRTTIEEQIGASLRQALYIYNEALPSVAEALLEVGERDQAVEIASGVLDSLLAEDPDWDVFRDVTGVLARAGAADKLDRAAAFVRDLDADHESAALLPWLALAWARLGDSTKSLAALQEQAKFVARIRQPYAQVYFTMLAAIAAFELKDPSAGKLAIRALDVANAHISDDRMVELLQSLVGVFADAGDSARAAAVTQSIVATAERTGRAGHFASAAVALARLGEQSQAAGALSCALRAGQNLNRVELFELTSSLAEALSQLRKPQEIRSLAAAIDRVDGWWASQATTGGSPSKY